MPKVNASCSGCLPLISCFLFLENSFVVACYFKFNKIVLQSSKKKFVRGEIITYFYKDMVL
jgi:hypothetical protein